MSKKYIWNAAKYRAALLGDADNGVKGLRSLAYGFEAADGFNLHDINTWTPAQRRKVRETFKRVEELEAQPKIIVRPRSQKKLKQLQQSFHGDTISKNLKVAFLPFSTPKLTKGAKQQAPKVRMLKEGVSIQTPQYERVFIPFNHRRLATNPEAEIKRAAEQIPGAALYFVQNGNNQTLNGKSIRAITEQIIKWMGQYDGVKPLPKTSGNRGDSPKSHHWKKWLDGLVGYVLPKRVDVLKLSKIIKAGREANEQRKRAERNFMKRKSVKRKGEK